MTRRKLLINAATCIMQKQANTNTLIDARKRALRAWRPRAVVLVETRLTVASLTWLNRASTAARIESFASSSRVEPRASAVAVRVSWSEARPLTRRKLLIDARKRALRAWRPSTVVLVEVKLTVASLTWWNRDPKAA